QAVQQPTPGPSQEGNRQAAHGDRLPCLGGVGGGLAHSSQSLLRSGGSNGGEVIIISDADVHVPTDFLANVVPPLPDPGAGLVNSFTRLANPATLAMQFEPIAINADFWSQVLQARSLKPLDFALGAVMATTRRRLESIGGFAALVDFLADDYQL